jgi:mannose-6-phosphate isomerase-like protein (cupin superfamily)
VVLTVAGALVFPATAFAVPGAISTVAGSGTSGFSGDGGPATAAELFGAQSVATTADRGFLIADTNNHRIRKVSAAGIITTVAGDGTNGFGGDGGPATAAQMSSPRDVAATADGGFLIADTTNLRVRRVSPSGTISTVAGNGNFGTPVDGAPAAASPFGLVAGVAPTDDGGFLIVDDSNSSVFEVSAGGIVRRVAGNNTLGFSGDGGPATAAQMHFPQDVSVTGSGGFLIADGSVNNRIRDVTASGTITTAAGSGAPFAAGFSGDGRSAVDAQLSAARGVAATADGGFLIADTGNGRIRKISADGIISTVAGDNFGGFDGDGGPATSASLSGPFSVAPTAGGGFLIADVGNNRIRRVEGDAPVLGKAVNVQVVKGKVLVRPATGRKFVPLGGSRQIPVGSVLDTRKGTVGLTSAINAKGATQQGQFSNGVFRVVQSRRVKARGLTELRLQGSNFQGCRAAGHGSVGAASHSRRKVRSLRATAKGRFRTRGRYSVATATVPPGRGANWQTTDRCDGTLVTVSRGKVAVRDLSRNKTITVPAGKRYLAHAQK